MDNGVLNEVSYTVTGKGEQAVCTLTIDGTAYDLAEYIQMHAPVADAFYVTDLVENIGTPEEDDGLEIAVLDEGTDGPIFSNMMEIFTIWARSEDSRSETGMPDLAVLTARAV